MRVILSVILALFFYTSVYPSEFWPRTRTDYYRENVHSEYYEMYYTDHWDGFRSNDCDWDFYENYWDRQLIRQEEGRDDWWDDEYRNWLRDQDVDEGLMLGW